jgi:hypothetical protein
MIEKARNHLAEARLEKERRARFKAEDKARKARANALLKYFAGKGPKPEPLAGPKGIAKGPKFVMAPIFSAGSIEEKREAYEAYNVVVAELKAYRKTNGYSAQYEATALCNYKKQYGHIISNAGYFAAYQNYQN